MVSDSSLNLLLLHVRYTTGLSYYNDWLDAFVAHPAFAVTALNLAEPGVGERLGPLVREADLIVVLHSATSDNVGLGYLQRVVPWLTERRGGLLVFMGNEYNTPDCSMVAKMALLRETRAEWVATMLPLEAGRWLYGECPDSRVVFLPHGLNPAVFTPGPPTGSRPIDLGVRSDRYPVFLGDDQRNRLFERFLATPFDPPLVLDIRTGQRLERSAWADFLRSCKGTVANEAGASHLERDDATVNAIRAYVARRERAAGRLVIPQSATLWKLGHLLPPPLRRGIRRLLGRGVVRYEANLNADLEFEEIDERFFRHRPPSPVSGRHMTSRHFDAIGTGTCQILVRGHYSGILGADRHYLALEPDFSNLGAVVERFRDPAVREGIVAAARELVLSGHTLHHRLESILTVVGARGGEGA